MLGINESFNIENSRVRVESIKGIPNMETRQYLPLVEIVASDHLSYFVDEDSLKVLSKILQSA